MVDVPGGISRWWQRLRPLQQGAVVALIAAWQNLEKFRGESRFSTWLHRIAANEDARAQDIVRGADVVIAALGYRPHALPVFACGGEPMRLAADTGAAMVDRHCRVLDAAGAPIAGLYGIGLAAGFVPWGRLGGEASFRGQANGLWLWQNDVGMMIVDQLLDEAARVAAG